MGGTFREKVFASGEEFKMLKEIKVVSAGVLWAGEGCLVEVFFVRLQNKQKGRLEKKVAVGTGLMMLNGRFLGGGRDVEY